MIQEITELENSDLIDHTPFMPGRTKVRRVKATLPHRPAKPVVGYLNAPGSKEPSTVPIMHWMD